MVDIVDHAQKREEEHRADALERRRRAAAGDAAESSGVCVGCGCDIPEARLKALPTAQRCTDCQERFERHQRGMGV